MSLIVTFGCQRDIFIYEDGSDARPMLPYKVHATETEAAAHLMRKGVLPKDIRRVVEPGSATQKFIVRAFPNGPYLGKHEDVYVVTEYPLLCVVFTSELYCKRAISEYNRGDVKKLFEIISVYQ